MFVIGEWALNEAVKLARKKKKIDLVMALSNAMPFEQAMQQQSRGTRDMAPKDDRAELRKANAEREAARERAIKAAAEPKPLAEKKSK